MSQGHVGLAGRGNQADYLLGTAEGWDAFKVVRWHAIEEISQPYQYEITLMRPAGAGPADLDALIDTDATFAVAAQSRWRRVHGILAEAEEIDRTTELLLYRVLLAPHFWRARHRRRCRTFVNRTLFEIVSAVLENRSPAHPEGLGGLARSTGPGAALGPYAPAGMQRYVELIARAGRMGTAPARPADPPPPGPGAAAALPPSGAGAVPAMTPALATGAGLMRAVPAPSAPGRRAGIVVAVVGAFLVGGVAAAVLLGRGTRPTTGPPGSASVAPAAPPSDPHAEGRTALPVQSAAPAVVASTSAPEASAMPAASAAGAKPRSGAPQRSGSQPAPGKPKKNIYED